MLTWTVACGWSPTALLLWFSAEFEYYATGFTRLAGSDLKYFLKLRDIADWMGVWL